MLAAFGLGEEERCTKIPWSKPVNINMLDGRCRTVVGPLDAMHCLQSEWPVRERYYVVPSVHAMRRSSAERGRKMRGCFHRRFAGGLSDGRALRKGHGPGPWNRMRPRADAR